MLQRKREITNFASIQNSTYIYIQETGKEESENNAKLKRNDK